MTVLDDLYRWLLDALSRRISGAGPLLAFPTVVIAVPIGMRLLVRRVLPLLVWCVLALTNGAAFLLGVLLLGVDFVIASCFRICRLRPPSLVYALGDTLITTMRATQTGFGMLRTRAARLGNLGGLGGLGLLVLTFALLWWWNAEYCARTTTAGCVVPAMSWLDLLIQ
jgi:hypothetical protein